MNHGALDHDYVTDTSVGIRVKQRDIVQQCPEGYMICAWDS